MFFLGLRAMKDRKKYVLCIPWKAFFYLIVLLLFCSANLLFFRDYAECWQPKLVASWRKTDAIEAISGDPTALPPIKIRETVILPDQALVFLKYPSSAPLFTKNDISCIYRLSNSSGPQMELLPESTEDNYVGSQIVRCPLPPRGYIISVAIRSKSNGNLLSAGPTYLWNSLAYEAVIDRDNTTVVFAKGFNLRGGKAADPSRFKCIYGWDFRKSKFTLQSDVVSVAQEIVRCRTPLSLLNSLQKIKNSSIKVSVRMVGRRGVLNSIARLQFRLESRPVARKQHEMCVCTMLRNQDRFLREWVIYHGKIGVERWFIYDNNSDDDIAQVIESLVNHNYNVTRHVWPWIKSQEAGFSHCALRARDSCEWVGFIDVDEFFHFPSDTTLHDILRNKSMSKEVGELRASCHSFGPSGLKKIPAEGVMVGYTCRMIFPERHKSIVRPEALNNTLINVVHHFQLKQGFEHAKIERHNLVINHYKYQVWEVFKEKFYRRVATYVSDWQQEQNVGSKDRAPGLGTRAVEPPDWSSRFCEVKDTGLKDRVLKSFIEPKTGLLPWQQQ